MAGFACPHAVVSEQPHDHLIVGRKVGKALEDQPGLGRGKRLTPLIDVLAVGALAGLDAAEGIRLHYAFTERHRIEPVHPIQVLVDAPGGQPWPLLQSVPIRDGLLTCHVPWRVVSDQLGEAAHVHLRLIDRLRRARLGDALPERHQIEQNGVGARLAIELSDDVVCWGMCVQERSDGPMRRVGRRLAEAVAPQHGGEIVGLRRST